MSLDANIRLAEMARDTFKTDEEAAAWLTQPQPIS